MDSDYIGIQSGKDILVHRMQSSSYRLLPNQCMRFCNGFEPVDGVESGNWWSVEQITLRTKSRMDQLFVWPKLPVAVYTGLLSLECRVAGVATTLIRVLKLKCEWN